MMRRVLIVAVLLALVAMPMAFAGTGFCRAMPCCAPHIVAGAASMGQPGCCTPSSCDQPPSAAGEFTAAKKMHHHAPAITADVIAVVAASPTLPAPPLRGNVSPPHQPAPLHQRIALLSSFLI